jgi:hypothetical protein
MNAISRRAFLQALGLSVPAIAAAKFLPEETPAPRSIADDLSCLDSPRAERFDPPTPGKGRYVTELVIGGVSYECISLDLEQPRSSVFDTDYREYLYISDPPYGRFKVLGLQPSLTNLVGEGAQDIVVVMKGYIVSFKASFGSWAAGYDDRIKSDVTTIDFDFVHDVVAHAAEDKS